jgi:hypothetical protein
MNRRHLLTGLIAAPAVILTPGLLMPVKAWKPSKPKIVITAVPPGGVGAWKYMLVGGTLFELGADNKWREV